MSELSDTLGEALSAFEVHSMGLQPERGSHTILSLSVAGITKLLESLVITNDDQVLLKFSQREPLVDVTQYLLDRTGAILGYCGLSEIVLLFRDNLAESQSYTEFAAQAISSASFWMGAKTASSSRFELDHSIPTVTFDCKAYRFPSRFLATRFFEWKQTLHQTEVYQHLAHELLPKGVAQTLPARQQKNKLLEQGVDLDGEMQRYVNGQVIRRRIAERPLTERELAWIDERKRRPGQIGRRPIYDVDSSTPSFALVANLEEFLLDNDEAVYIDGDFALNITP